MDRKLYDLMDWAAVEEVVYSESADPHAVLGPHVIPEGLLIQAFVPHALRVEAVLTDTGETVEMDREDENGFFACLIRNSGRVPYRLRIRGADDAVEEIEDPYAFIPAWEEEDLQKFAAGNHIRIWHLRHPFVRVGAQCPAGFCGGRFQPLGRKTPPDGPPREFRRIPDLYPRTFRRCDLQI